MTDHEPECWLSKPDAPDDAKRDGEFCECDIARAAYGRGRDDASLDLQVAMAMDCGKNADGEVADTWRQAIRIAGSY